MARPQSSRAIDEADPEVRYALDHIAELGAATYHHVDRDCDMVMKGGITSGVVYPLTICRIATRYRLRSIGGTSAGAIAAGVAAAAEYRRRSSTGDDASAGYRALAALPTLISTQLESLFQARPETRRLYGVLNAAIDPDWRGARKAVAVIARIITGKLAWFLAGFVLTLGLVIPGLLLTGGFPNEWGDVGLIVIGLVLPALLATVVGTATAVTGFAREANRVLPTTGFALTDGATHDATPGLTDWLADQIDTIAGVDPATACLTLGDLWGPDAVAAWQTGNDHAWVKAGPTWRARSTRHLSLEVMTTDLTIRRPFRMPFTTQEFMFAASEWATLFPPRVVATMTKPEFLTDHLHPDTGERLYRFPGAGSVAHPEQPGPDALPVIVMVRMSLSFPGLISAVPLYAVDFNGDQSVVRHWFSDGGVSSNFPMHFFDALLPTRPTFGVNLAPLHRDHPDTVWRASPTTGGTIPRAHPFTSLGGFIGALRDTVQNWADNKQITQRGYADRVVEIRLSSDEGGMNLRMPATRVLKLVARGAKAGESLLEFDWDAHRVIRYRSTTARLNDVLDHMRTAWRADDGALYPQHLASYPRSGAPGGSYLGGTAWRTDDQAATDALAAAIDTWADADWPALQHGWPQPAPHIRAAPE